MSNLRFLEGGTKTCSSSQAALTEEHGQKLTVLRSGKLRGSCFARLHLNGTCQLETPENGSAMILVAISARSRESGSWPAGVSHSAVEKAARLAVTCGDCQDPVRRIEGFRRLAARLHGDWMVAFKSAEFGRQVARRKRSGDTLQTPGRRSCQLRPPPGEDCQQIAGSRALVRHEQSGQPGPQSAGTDRWPCLIRPRRKFIFGVVCTPPSHRNP